MFVRRYTISAAIIAAAFAVIGGAAPGSRAANIQINDIEPSDLLVLSIDGTIITGNGGSITNYSNTTDPVSTKEILTFTYDSGVPWAANTLQYNIMSNPIDITSNNPYGLAIFS